MAAYKSLDEHLFHHLEQLYPDLGLGSGSRFETTRPSAVEPTLRCHLLARRNEHVRARAYCETNRDFKRLRKRFYVWQKKNVMCISGAGTFPGEDGFGSIETCASARAVRSLMLLDFFCIAS